MEVIETDLNSLFDTVADSTSGDEMDYDGIYGISGNGKIIDSEFLFVCIDVVFNMDKKTVQHR